MILKHCYDIVDHRFWCIPTALRLADLVRITPSLYNEVLNVKYHGGVWKRREASAKAEVPARVQLSAGEGGAACLSPLSESFELPSAAGCSCQARNSIRV